jgi:hypothetical protein
MIALMSTLPLEEVDKSIHSGALCCKTERICVMQVNTDVQIVLEALGLADSKDAQKEEEALKDVHEILKPHMGATWVTGKPNNRT